MYIVFSIIVIVLILLILSVKPTPTPPPKIHSTQPTFDIYIRIIDHKRVVIGEVGHEDMYSFVNENAITRIIKSLVDNGESESLYGTNFITEFKQDYDINGKRRDRYRILTSDDQRTSAILIFKYVDDKVYPYFDIIVDGEKLGDTTADVY